MNSRRRRLLPLLLLLHALAHTLPGMRVATALHWWIPGSSVPSAVVRWAFAVAFWGAAVVGFSAAAFGLLGAPRMAPWWRRSLQVGIAGSLTLLAFGWSSLVAIPGIAIDLALIVWLKWNPGLLVEAPAGRRRIRHALASAYIILLALLILIYPWHMRWGSTEQQLHAPLPGDDSTNQPTYLVEHAVTIYVPAEAVWPWLAQLGGERAGFYSHAWLENLFGLHIRNADQVHPEWQERRAGDSVFATPIGWLGLKRRLGWRIARLEANRVLVLENWGAFVLQPEGPRATRLIARTRGTQPDRLSGVLFAPVGFLLFEPAHFIMGRQMLLGIKRRAEDAAGL